MKIRAITCFLNPAKSNYRSAMLSLGVFSKQALELLNSAGYQVQSKRLATIPFPKYIKSNRLQEATLFLQELLALIEQTGFQYLSIGECCPESLRHYSIIPELLGVDDRIFASGSMTTHDGKISMDAIRACAEVIHTTTQINSDGFANLRFAALANVKPYTPFFPAAYSESNNPAVSIAMEGADLAVNVFKNKNGSNLVESQKQFREVLNEHGRRLESILKPVCKQNKVDFKGLDFSLAPYPTGDCSIVAAIEAAGVSKVGTAGSVAVAAMIASALDQGKWKKTGFNGLMFPVLEDSILAQRVAEGDLTWKDLLLYACVCGTGLDTIPLAGDIRVEQITSILTDVAALSSRLHKPLTARLMPIPGKNVWDPTTFTFEYFSNSRIMDVRALEFMGSMAKSRELPVIPKI
jgi:uncharacterized protein (UPF0210 family)